MTQTDAKFWDKHARRYAAAKIRNVAAYEHTLSRTRSYLKPIDRVLELGCGTGTTALALAGSVAQITGTDVSPEMVRIADEKANAAGQTNATFRVATVQQALAGAGPVDAILAFNLLHLLEGAAAASALALAALPKGGYFITKTPCLADPSLGLKRFAFAAIIPPLGGIGLAPAMRRLTFADLERQIAGAGFEIVETGSFPAISRFIVARKP